MKRKPISYWKDQDALFMCLELCGQITSQKLCRQLSAIMILKYSDLKVVSDTRYLTTMWISGTLLPLRLFGESIPEGYL